MMIFENALHKEHRVSRATMLAFIQLLAPFAPHFAEEVWSRLGAPGLAPPRPGRVRPREDVAAEVRLVFQVNGKHRGDQLVPVGLPQDQAVALAKASEKVALPRGQDGRQGRLRPRPDPEPGRRLSRA
jgi:leucyl-tRNA synthetase